MTTADTHGCFSEFVGQKVVGVLFQALPVNRRDIARGTKALIFEDGRALVISSNGSYWVENKHEVLRAIDLRKRALEDGNREIERVLEAAGAFTPTTAPQSSPDSASPARLREAAERSEHE